MPARLSALALSALALACVPQPVAWDAEQPLPGGAEGAALVIDAAGRVTQAAEPGATAFAPPNACPNSVRVARAAGAERYAVWWAPRADSTAHLLAARSSDGGLTWPHGYVVDSLDRGRVGCARPAPAVAADSANGYVHVAYALDAPEGAGIFYAHLMDPRARFEVPAAIVYGERPGAASVASDDSVVAVAYENPNTARPTIAAAVSRTAGHTFESKAIEVSGSQGDATAPRVAVRGTRVAVAWLAAGRAPMVRVGTVR